jgi:hypothetical protein
LEIHDSTNDILKNLVKQDLVNKNYILLDDSDAENILITFKDKREYMKLCSKIDIFEFIILISSVFLYNIGYYYWLSHNNNKMK